MTGGTVTHVISGLTDGGAEATLFRLCTTDTLCTHQVVSLMDDGKYGVLLRNRGIQVDCLRMKRGRISVAGLWRLYKLLKTGAPTVVQTWMYHADLIGGVVGRLAGVRKVFWAIHNSRMDQTTAKQGTIWVCRVNAFLSRWIPSAIVCCAKQALVAHVSLGYSRQRMVVVRNGYDLVQFRPDDEARARIRKELGIDEATPLLALIARFDPNKDHPNLIRALSLLKDRGLHFRVLLIGEGITEHNQELMRQIRAGGVQDLVRLLGPRNDVPAIMNAIDINLLSSLSEAFPNVLAEAMACGTPCVTTDVGDAASIVNGTGWLVPPQDPESFAIAIAKAVTESENEDAWERRRQAARARIEERFSVEKMIGDYHRLWFA